MDTPDAKETISTLNKLIETLKDGEEGYKQAAEGTKSPELEAIFGEYASQRHEFAKELQKAAYALGEAKPEHTSSVASAIHRGWINLKSALTGEDAHAVLAECERGEDSAVSAYRDALAGSDLTATVRPIVQKQYDGVLAAHDRIKMLRDQSATR